MLVLGILSLAVCSILGPVAWIKGTSALNEIRANPSVTYGNRGSIVAGRICGIVASVLLILGALFVVLAVVAFAARGSA